MHPPSVPVLLALAIALTASLAVADEAADYEKAKTAYDAGDYAAARERFRALLDAASPSALADPALVQRARLLYIVCLVATGELAEADREIETVYRNDPRFVPDPAALPGPVIDRFGEVRARIRVKLEQDARKRLEVERAERARQEETRRLESQRLERLTALAGEERIVVRNSRAVASLPFGIGQFQNDQTALGWTFAISEVALGATAIVSAALHDSALGTQPEKSAPPEYYAQFRTYLETTKMVNYAAAAGFAVVAVGGIVHAQLTFVPERVEVRRRELPPELSVRAALSFGDHSMFAGVTGTY